MQLLLLPLLLLLLRRPQLLLEDRQRLITRDGDVPASINVPHDTIEKRHIAFIGLNIWAVGGDLRATSRLPQLFI
jgi:hypothetical protein